MRLGESVRVLRDLPPRHGCDIHEAAGRDAVRTPALPAVIGVERGATHLYPLATMDVTRLQMTSIKPGKMVDRGPMNTFSHLREFPAADLKVAVRPSFDMLYSSGRLDLTRGPVAVSAPDTSGRCCVPPMIDLWTEVFTVPGRRTGGKVAADFAAVRTLAPRIAQVHIKDALPTKAPGTWGSEVRAGTGAVDWPAFFDALAAVPATIRLAIEREAGDDRVADIRAAVEMLRARGMA